jgi:glycerophosphoryl diester phosphodiesterase
MTSSRRLYAHRGTAGELPENTLPGFVRALSQGATALEMDAHMTRDGHVVIAHDPDGARTANVARAIAQCTLHEVKAWDAGWAFLDAQGQRPFAGQGIQVPTLHEVLRACPDVPINVDVKQESPSMVRAIVDVIAANHATERVLLTSFSRVTMRALHALPYSGPIGAGMVDVVKLWALPRPLVKFAHVQGARVQLPTHMHTAVGELRFDTRRFIDAVHATGAALDYWTINDVDEARRLLALGADGIMSDVPAVVLPAFTT